MKDIKLKDKIAQGINDLSYIWKREFQTTFRDQGVLIFFILVPLGYPLLYSFIYDNEVACQLEGSLFDAFCQPQTTEIGMYDQTGGSHVLLVSP